jgi:hypothetical protein
MNRNQDVTFRKGKPYIKAYPSESGTFRAALKRECYACGKIFYVKENQINTNPTNKGFFCSQKCNGLWHAKRYHSARPRKTCPICGTRFDVPKSYARGIITCGKEYCKAEYRRQNMLKVWVKRRAEKEKREGI